MAEAKLIEAMARGIESFDGPFELSRSQATRLARAALSAAEEAGYAIVPREPTEAMLDAISREDGCFVELMRQWLYCHAEHCGAHVPPWPHPGDCQWPMPKLFDGSLTTNQISLLLFEASGE